MECKSLDDLYYANALVLATPVHTGLLSVNKQISEEALPVFYRNTTLVLDSGGMSCIRFIRMLPRATRRRITSMAITTHTLASDDLGSKDAWYHSDLESPRYRAMDGLELTTPFAITLAKNLPNLKTFSFPVPGGGTTAKITAKITA